MGKSQQTLNVNIPPTRWTRVRLAGHERTTIRRPALGELVQCYRPALIAHLVLHKRIEHHRAEDLVQGFMCDKVLEKNLVAKADPSRGKFRTLLLTALDNYVTSVDRRENAAKRGKSKQVGFDLAVNAADPKQSPSFIFDLSWARQVLSITLDRMKQECERDQQSDKWALFDCRIRQPAFESIRPPSYEELMGRFGLRSPIDVSNKVLSAKRMFERTLKNVVAQYVGNSLGVDQEIKNLIEILSSYPHQTDLSTRMGTSRSRRSQSRSTPQSTSGSGQLADLMRLGVQGPQPWECDELATLWLHLLDQPIAAEALSEEKPETKQTRPVMPYSQLLHMPCPPLTVLRQVKNYAKAASTKQNEGPLPVPIATLLYYACIAAALVRLDQRITRIEPTLLKSGLKWGIDQPWVDPKTRSLFRQALGDLP